jgi:hypothetical protein
MPMQSGKTTMKRLNRSSGPPPGITKKDIEK